MKIEDFKLRQKTFKDYRVRAIKLMLKYEQFIREYGQPNDITIGMAVMAGRLKKEDIENQTPAFLEIVEELLYNNMPAREVFLLDHAKELCDIIFEDCNIEHKMEWENEEYTEYMAFMQEVLSFFLMTSKQLNNVKPHTENSEQNLQAIQT